MSSGSPTQRRARRRTSLRPSTGQPSRLRPLDAGTGTAPLMDHLEELRTRIVVVALVLGAMFGVAYWQLDLILRALDRPLAGRWHIVTLGVTEPFFTMMSIAAQAAFVVTTPVIAWNIWRFVRPALDVGARRMIATLLLVAPGMFVGGVLFGYYFVLPPALRVLLGIGPDNFDVQLRAADYYRFVSNTLLASGAVFLFPLLLMGLARVGVISAGKLAARRKVAYVQLMIFAALLPTADPVSLVIETAPLLALYELSILAIRWQERRWSRARDHDTFEGVIGER
ncbi:MAG: Sec-independent protein translocase, TatC subunit [Thermoleophilia bacterium]|nr:Sec-independent protein translocase, TatC subunit [Thermoleophilia bacterium]